MPELPDLDVLAAAWTRGAAGQALQALHLRSPFLLRTVQPPPQTLIGRALQSVSRQGKRIVLRFDGGAAAVLHLMIAGRVRRRAPRGEHKGRDVLAVLTFATADYVLTEASRQHRAALHVFADASGPASLQRQGIEPLVADFDAWCGALRTGRHTLKRLLTDPDRISGVGNAYSDEILHVARMSPLQRGDALSDDGVATLRDAARLVLGTFRDRIAAELGDDGFPEHMTAFRPDFSVHGRYRQPCPVCTHAVQRIVRGSHETNYCASCQTGGRVLADRALSTLMRGEWPTTLEEWEERRRPSGPAR